MVSAEAPVRPRDPGQARSAISRSGGRGSPRPDATPPRRDRRGEAQWVDTALVAVALLAGFAGLHPLLQGISWWFLGLGVVVLVLGVAAVVRRAAGRGWAGPLSGLAAGTAVLTPVFAPDSGIAGLIPTGDTWDEAGLLVRRGLASIAEQSIPAEAVPGILFLTVVPLILVTVAADLIVLEARLPALGAVPFLALLVVPTAVQEGISDAYAWIVALAAYLMLLRRGLPAGSRALAVAAGGIVGVGSLVVPLVLPSPVPQSLDAPIGLGGHANPIVDLGTDLRRSTPVQVLEYTTKEGTQPYLRLATLSDFQGDVWAPQDAFDQAYALDSVPPPEGLTAGVATTTRRVSIRVEDVGGRWLPLPYPVTSVTGTQGDWSIEPDGLTARSAYLTADGQRYSATYLTVSPTRSQLAASGSSEDPGFQRYLALPSGIDPLVLQTARRVTRNATSDWQRAVDLQAYFRSQFTYSEQTPVDDGYDGSGVGVLGQFLRKKEGYCVHFASAMAVMARQLGIPSRVVVGYLPGQTSGRGPDGTATYAVSSSSLHAWPELYFPGVGWTRFEPTASRGDVPSYSTASASDDGAAPTDAPTAAPTAAPTTTTSPAPQVDEQQQSTRNSAAGTSSSAPAVLGWIGGLIGLLIVLLVPAGVRRAMRLVRLARADTDRDAATAAWTELRDTARDVGWRAPPTETVRDFAERLEIALPGQADAIERLRGAVETEAYGRWRGIGIDSRDLRAVLTALERTVPPTERLRAILAPPSLLVRLTPRGDAA